MTNDLCVIFDMDGVILDTETTVTQCWVDAAKEIGLDPDVIRKASLDAIGMNEKTTRELFDARFRDVDFYTFDHTREVERVYFERAAKDGIPTKPGAKELLEWLHISGASVGLATSTRKSNATKELEAVSLLSYFHEMVCGDMIRVGKPDPEIYLLCAKKLGRNPSNVYAIEDSYNGIKSAHAAGMRVIMVPDCLPPTKETDAMCIATLPSLYEVKEFLLKKIL